MAMQRLKEASEKAKVELSSSSETEINLPYIMPVDGIPQHLVRKLSRSKFEQLNDKLIKATLEPCRKALSDAGLKPTDINEVILVGGSTRYSGNSAIGKRFLWQRAFKRCKSR
jgi:molecular chaperone DnaK